MQVLEQIRRRTQDLQTPQPIPVADTITTPDATVADTSNEGTATSSASASSQKSSPQGTSQAGSGTTAKIAKSSAASSKSASKSNTAKFSHKEPVTDGDYAVSEQSAGDGGATHTTAVWSQGFLGYDRHSNLAPGNQENPTRTATTGGGLIGADWTHVTRSNGVSAVQYGVFMPDNLPFNLAGADNGLGIASHQERARFTKFAKCAASKWPLATAARTAHAGSRSWLQLRNRHCAASASISSKLISA